MKYLNERKINQLINKIEKSTIYGEILSCKLNGDDILALHEALMGLQQLVKYGFIKFDDEGFLTQEGLIKITNSKNRS